MQRYRVETDRQVPGQMPSLIKYERKGSIPQVKFVYFTSSREEFARIMRQAENVTVN